MGIKKLHLCNFRNYTNQLIEFHPSINILIGKNGQGKTNILEAIYFLGFLRSFRTSTHQNLKLINSDGFHILSEIESLPWDKTLYVEHGIKRILKTNNNIVHKSSEFIGEIKPVIFTNDDIQIILGSSKIRRKFIDIIISLIDRRYLLALQNYSIALKSINSIIRNSKNYKETNNLISAFIPIFEENALFINELRSKYFKLIEEKADKILKNIKSGKFELKLRYQSRINNKIIKDNLVSSFIRDEIFKNTKRGFVGIGPHLDDFEILLNGKNMKNYSSLGECRAASISIKMAEIELLINNDKSNKVIALIDDVTGELDSKTKDAFLSLIVNANQSFFTFSKKYDDKFHADCKKFLVENGTVTELNQI